MDKQPLVSVCVITYNSSKYVLETLESIYNQTYRNLELIVSDDCSTDNTVEICREWIAQHQDRFVRTEIVTVPKNTGISANCNRAYRACRAEWVKGIAGDDLLLPECVSTNMQYVKEHPEARLVFSKIKPFGNEAIIDDFYKVFRLGYAKLSMSPRALFYFLRLGNFVPASTTFIQRSLHQELGGYDESIPLLEDWPFWVKAAWHKVHFHFTPVYTVKYRMHDSSISLGEISPAFKESCRRGNDYVNGVIRKTNWLLFAYKWCSVRRASRNPLVRWLMWLGKAANPITYYVKYIEYKAHHIMLDMKD